MDIPKRPETGLKPAAAAAPAPAPAPAPAARAAPAPAQHQHQHQRQHQHQQHQDQHQHHLEQVTNRRITTVSCDRRVRSYDRVAPSTARLQFYYSFARSTRTILRKGQHQRQHQHQQHQDQHQHQLEQVITNRRITTVSCDRRVRSYERVAPSTARSQFYYSFARSTRPILRKGSSGSGKIAILPQFRAIDAHDLTKGFIQLRQDRNFTTVSRDRHVRSYERVHPAPARSQFYYSFARSTRPILRKGCISASIFRTMAAPPLIT